MRRQIKVKVKETSTHHEIVQNTSVASTKKQNPNIFYIILCLCFLIFSIYLLMQVTSLRKDIKVLLEEKATIEANLIKTLDGYFLQKNAQEVYRKAYESVCKSYKEETGRHPIQLFTIKEPNTGFGTHTSILKIAKDIDYNGFYYTAK